MAAAVAFAGVAGPAVAADEQGPRLEIAWERFEVAGRPAFVVLPDEIPDKSTPWVFYAPTFDRRLPNGRDEGWMIKRLLDGGVALAGIDVGESYGSPEGVGLFDALYEHLVEKRGFAPKAGLLARSRGGLMLYNWAATNPGRVHCIAGIYPVCNLESYPGLAKACAAYGMSEEELGNKLDEFNPVDRLTEIAKAKVPIFHIHGDVDKVVPLQENSGLVDERYRNLGGKMELVIAEGQGHNMWKGFFQCAPLVEFLVEHVSVPDAVDDDAP